MSYTPPSAIPGAASSVVTETAYGASPAVGVDAAYARADHTHGTPASDPSDADPATPSLRSLGAGAQQACAGDDPRLSDARAPTGAAGGSLAGTYPNPTIAAQALIYFLTMHRRLSANWVIPAATTRTNIGNTGFTPSGTVTNADDADGPWQNMATGAVSGNTAGIAHTTADAAGYRRWLSRAVFRIRTATDITSQRVFIGFASAAISNADDQTSHNALFRYSTAAGDTKWQCLTNDNSGGSTVTDSTVTVSADTVYDLEIRLLASSVEFWINGVLRATNSGDLPDSATSLGIRVWIITQTNGARSIKWSRHVVLSV